MSKTSDKADAVTGCGLELRDTVAGMLSADYRDRFVAEYRQLDIRVKGLLRLLGRWDRGELHFTPTCPRDMLGRQLDAMLEYRGTFEKRAVLGGIDLGGAE